MTEKLKILLVEDTKTLREIYKSHISSLGKDKYEIFEAATVKEGIELFNNEMPDCLILDFVLPDGNGLEVLKKIKAHEFPQPVILITSYGNEALILEAMRNGAQHYINKEKITPEVLLIAIEQTIERVALLKQSAVRHKEMEHFAHILAHDLRDPLVSIDGMLRLLKMHNTNKLDDKSEDYLKTAIKCCSHMQEMIHDLYAYCHLETDIESMLAFSGDEIIETMKGTLANLIKERSVQMSIEQPLPTLFGVKSLLTQLFTNLVQNAIKYSPTSPQVEIRYQETPTHWQFSVKDNGIGIPEKEHQKIFELFHRVNNQPDIAGSGLGLSICHKIVQLHGGEIWVESSKDKGSTFFFTIAKGN